MRRMLSHVVANTGCGYLGRRPLSPAARNNDNAKPLNWLQLVQGTDPVDATASGIVYLVGSDFKHRPMHRQHADQLLGMCVGAQHLAQAIPFALEQHMDLLLLDCTPGITQPWVELQTHPDLTLLRDAINILRQLGKEEEIALLNFGGIRSGTDVAKALAINCSASVFGLAAALAMGVAIDKQQLVFPDVASAQDPAAALESWIQATSQETAVIARCTGKTSVHNLEPEDMRCISVATASALGLPMASGAIKREGF